MLSNQLVQFVRRIFIFSKNMNQPAVRRKIRTSHRESIKMLLSSIQFWVRQPLKGMKQSEMNCELLTIYGFRSSAGRALQREHRGHVFESRWNPETLFFGLLRTWVNCDSTAMVTYSFHLYFRSSQFISFYLSCLVLRVADYHHMTMFSGVEILTTALICPWRRWRNWSRTNSGRNWWKKISWWSRGANTRYNEVISEMPRLLPMPS